MSDPYLLRDERGNPLTSVFHEVPKKVNEFVMIHRRKQGKAWQREALKLFNALFPNQPITNFHPDDMKGDEEE